MILTVVTWGVRGVFYKKGRRHDTSPAHVGPMGSAHEGKLMQALDAGVRSKVEVSGSLVQWVERQPGGRFCSGAGVADLRKLIS